MKIKCILKVPVNQLRLLKKIGAMNYLRYRRARLGERISMTLKNNLVCIRKGTGDLGVAISCLIDGEFDAISEHLDKSFNGVIVDAGGYIGTAALALSRMFPYAQVISIEPSETNIEILKINVAGFNNIRVVYGALVGRDISEIELRNRGTGSYGFTVIEKPRDNLSAEILHKTPAFTLRKLVVNSAEIGVLKLDIEGGEFDLFTNDAETLREVKIVVVELHDRIAAGCTKAFNQFSKGRLVFKDNGEKYFSVKQG